MEIHFSYHRWSYYALARGLAKYNSSGNFDPKGDFIPYRSVGHPHLRWDDHIHQLCWTKWPLEYRDHWFDILKTKNVSAYEADFIEFMEIAEKSVAEDID